MNNVIIFLFLSLLSYSSASVGFVDLPMQNDPTTSGAPSTTLVPVTQTTVKTPPTTPSTVSTPTTTPSTVTTPPTTPSTVTTPPTTPSTVTTPPTTPSTVTTPATTPSTTTPTTVSPSTTSTAAPITTVAPPPAPLPDKWYVKDGNITCVVAQTIMSINITYPVALNKTQIASIKVTGNSNGTQVQGKCGNETQTLIIPYGFINLTIAFNKTAKPDYKVSFIQLQVNASALPNATTDGILTYTENATLFDTPLAMSYKCAKIQNVNLTSSANYTAILILKDTQFEAFRNTNTSGFGSAADCDSSVPDIVPIAVGCALTALVLVVLVAYLIGRHRTRATGYVSM